MLAKSKTITIECNLHDDENLPESNPGERIKKLRILKGLTIKDLSILCSLSQETISNIEKSRTTPNVNSLSKLSQALNTSNSYILGADSWSENSAGEIIYKYRMISGLSQMDLARKCNLHKSTTKDYENNKLSNLETLEIIYRAIGYL